MESPLCSSNRLLPSECLQINLLVPLLLVATSDSPHSLTHAFLPVFCHTFNSDANSDYNFFHSLLPSSLPSPTSKTSLVWQQIQYHSSAYSKIGSAAKRGKRKRRLCFAGKLQRNNIRNQLCEGGTKSTRRERGRRESTDCSSIN